MFELVLNLFNYFIYFTHRHILRPILSSIAQKNIKNGHFEIELPACPTMVFGNGTGQRVTLILNRPWHIFLRLLSDWYTGLGEGYMYGDYDLQSGGDLQALFNILLENRQSRRKATKKSNFLFSMVHVLMQSTGQFLNAAVHLLNRNTISGSRKNIERHYDLGNRMFELFLDDSMTYSCAIYKDPGESLEQAQMNKFDRAIETLKITDRDHILEIGCGWGSFAIRAVQQTGCAWTGLTISTEQLQMARDRVAKHGLQDKITLKLMDYRKEQSTYTKIVSIEMLEAVGHEYFATYFQTISRCLVPGGSALIQVITVPDSQYERYRTTPDFIKKHIFPGGCMPSMQILKENLPDSLVLDQSLFSMGHHYAPTLSIWLKRWLAKKQVIVGEMGYSAEFHRKWCYYFSLCISLFQNKYIDDVQFVLTKELKGEGGKRSAFGQ